MDSWLFLDDLEGGEPMNKLQGIGGTQMKALERH